MLHVGYAAILSAMHSTQEKLALLLTSGCAISWLESALQDAGWRVRSLAFEFTGRAEVESDARQLLGGNAPDLVLHCHLPKDAAALRLGDVSAANWQQLCEAPLRRTLISLQVARTLLDNRGAIVGLGPAFPLNGVAGLVALGAAVEGQRTLVKAAARQWIGSEIAVNWLALKTERLLPQLADVPQLGRFEVGSYGRRVPDDARLAALITAIAGNAGLAMAGQTLIADGGDWMTP